MFANVMLLLLIPVFANGSLLDRGNLNTFCSDMIESFGNSKAVHVILEEQDYNDVFKDAVRNMSKSIKVQTFKGNYGSLIDLDREELVLYSRRHFERALDEFDMNKEAWIIPTTFDSSIFFKNDESNKTFLRLDSEVYLYRDLGDSIMISEVYGIKVCFVHASVCNLPQ